MRTLYESLLDSDKTVTQQTKEYTDIVNTLSLMANAIKQTIKKFNCKIDSVRSATHGLGGQVLYKCKKDLSEVEFRRYLQDIPKFKIDIKVEFLDGGRFYWEYLIKDEKLFKTYGIKELSIEVDLSYVKDHGLIRVGVHRKKSTESPELCNLFINLLTE